MEEELNYGVMEAIIMVNIKLVRNMVKVCITGLTVLSMLGIGNKMKCMAMENLYGLMVENTKVNLSLE